jgi:protocatechuate 3,4-dioxygenase, beta subunit
MNRMRSFTAAFVLFSLVVVPREGAAQDSKGRKLQSAYTGKGYTLCGSCDVPKDVSWEVTLVPKGEPGEQLVLTGTIYKEDGVTPDSGITLFLYQADAGGYYHRPKENVFDPKIHGWLRTGKDGKYEIHSIKPAAEVLEPDGVAHIHIHIFGKNNPEHFLKEFWFEGDSHLTAEDMKRFGMQGNYSSIVHLVKGQDEVLRGVRNFRLRPTSAWKYEGE